MRTRSCALSFEVPAPSFEWIVGNPAVKLPMSGALFALQATLCGGRDKGCRPFPCTPFSACGTIPPLRSGQVSLDEAERFTAQSSCQRRYTPMVFGIIPECLGFPPELVFSFAGIPILVHIFISGQRGGPQNLRLVLVISSVLDAVHNLHFHRISAGRTR